MLIRHGVFFEDFVHATHVCVSVNALYDILQSTMLDCGYDRINFSVKRDTDLHDTQIGFGLFSTYPSDWQKYYAEQDFIRIDPVLRCAVSAYGPFRWSELERRWNLDRRQISFLREGEEAGLNSGLGIPFSGSRNQIAGIAVATSDARNRPLPNIDLLQAYANQFYTVYKRLVLNATREAPNFSILSDKETEVLQWIASGLTAKEVGDRLNITHNTVNYHLRNIFTKLDVNTSIEATLKAFDLDMIKL